jgi:hypothetical protein
MVKVTPHGTRMPGAQMNQPVFPDRRPGRAAAALPPEARDLAGALAAALRDGRDPGGAPAQVRRMLADLAPGRAADAGLALRAAMSPWHPSWRARLTRALWADADLAWLFLNAADGHLRQAAILRLRDLPTGPAELVWIVHRLNDWVPQVRAVADTWLTLRAPQIDPHLAAAALLILLPAAPGFTRWDRPQALDRLLAQPPVLDALARLLGTSTAPRLAPVLRRAMAAPGFDRHLPRLAEGAVQPALRAIACQALLTGQVRWVSGWRQVWTDRSLGQSRLAEDVRTRALIPTPLNTHVDPLTWLERAARDPAAQVRKVAGDHLPTLAPQDPARVAAVAQALSRDRNAAVRMRADWWLSRSAPAQGAWQPARPGPD